VQWAQEKTKSMTSKENICAIICRRLFCILEIVNFIPDFCSLFQISIHSLLFFVERSAQFDIEESPERFNDEAKTRGSDDFKKTTQTDLWKVGKEKNIKSAETGRR